MRSALCWSHARRKFFELADIRGKARKKKPAYDISPIALEAVKRTAAIFDVEREINGMDADARLAVGQERSRPLVGDLRNWLLEERASLSKHNGVAKASTTSPPLNTADGRPSLNSWTMGAYV